MPVETNGVVLEAQRLLGRPWAVVSLNLLFELPDGRQTAPYFVSGSAAIDQFLRQFGAATPEDLLGMVMTLQLNATAADHPAVMGVAMRAAQVPESIREAFGAEDEPA